MLILPPGHHQEVSRPRYKVSSRERWILGSVLALTAVLLVAVVISFTNGQQRTSGHGCIDVSAVTATGGSELYRCGAEARALCTARSGSGRENLAFTQALANACREAGLPVPRS